LNSSNRRPFLQPVTYVVLLSFAFGAPALAKSSSASRASANQQAANKSASQGMKGTAAHQQRMADYYQRKADREAKKK
jgi:hypothetical protein